MQPESDFSTLSLHEPTPEEKEKAEKLKNEGKKGEIDLTVLPFISFPKYLMFFVENLEV